MMLTLRLIVFWVLLLPICYPEAEAREVIVGGLSQEKKATPQIKTLVESVSSDITSAVMLKEKGNNIRNTIRTPSWEIKAISFRTQLVNGINYFIKIQMTTGEQTMYYHIRVYESFNGAAELMGLDGPKERKERIELFH